MSFVCACVGIDLTIDHENLAGIGDSIGIFRGIDDASLLSRVRCGDPIAGPVAGTVKLLCRRGRGLRLAGVVIVLR